MHPKASSVSPAVEGKVGPALRIHTKSAGGWIIFSQIWQSTEFQGPHVPHWSRH